MKSSSHLFTLQVVILGCSVFDYLPFWIAIPCGIVVACAGLVCIEIEKIHKSLNGSK